MLVPWRWMVAWQIAPVLFERSSDQTWVPNSAPIPAVTAIATAPQKVTRIEPLKIFAPPVLAPMAPSTARHMIETPATNCG
jgi:hypothetical protein